MSIVQAIKVGGLLLQALKLDEALLQRLGDTGRTVKLDSARLGRLGGLLDRLPELLEPDPQEDAPQADADRPQADGGAPRALSLTLPQGLDGLLTADFEAQHAPRAGPAQPAAPEGTATLINLLVGQQAVARIDRRIESLQDVATEVLSFLENEATSELEGIRLYLDYIAKNHPQICSNEQQRAAAVTCLHQSFITARKWMYFCAVRLDRLSLDILSARREEEGWALTKRYTQYILMYNLTCSIYTLAIALEVALTVDCTALYITGRRREIEQTLDSFLDNKRRTCGDVINFVMQAKKIPDSESDPGGDFLEDIVGLLRPGSKAAPEAKRPDRAVQRRIYERDLMAHVNRVEHCGQETLERIAAYHKGPLELLMVQGETYLAAGKG